MPGSPYCCSVFTLSLASSKVLGCEALLCAFFFSFHRGCSKEGYTQARPTVRNTQAGKRDECTCTVEVYVYVYVLAKQRAA